MTSEIAPQYHGESLTASFTPRASDILITVEGRISGFDAEPVARLALDWARTTGLDRIVLDMRAIEHLNSAGIQFLLVAQEELVRGKLSLRLLNFSPQARNLLKMTYLDHLFQFESS